MSFETEAWECVRANQVTKPVRDCLTKAFLLPRWSFYRERHGPEPLHRRLQFFFWHVQRGPKVLPTSDWSFLKTCPSDATVLNRRSQNISSGRLTLFLVCSLHNKVRRVKDLLPSPNKCGRCACYQADTTKTKTSGTALLLRVHGRALDRLVLDSVSGCRQRNGLDVLHSTRGALETSWISGMSKIFSTICHRGISAVFSTTCTSTVAGAKRSTAKSGAASVCATAVTGSTYSAAGLFRRTPQHLGKVSFHSGCRANHGWCT